jgi:hypothetical protein
MARKKAAGMQIPIDSMRESQLAGGAGSYRKPHARPANFGFVAVVAQL